MFNVSSMDFIWYFTHKTIVYNPHRTAHFIHFSAKVPSGSPPDSNYTL